MTELDWIFVVVLLVSLVLGVWRGFVYELLSVLNWLLAFTLAHWLGTSVGEHLPMAGVSDVLRFVAGFVVVFVLSALGGAVLVWLVSKLVKSAGMQPVDRVLGACFGLLRGVILLLAATVVVEMTPVKMSLAWQDSKAAGVSVAALKVLKPVLPEVVGRYLP